MAKQPSISGKDLIKLLQRKGFDVVRISGSHHRLNDLPKGLLRKIIREDLKLEMEEFNQLLVE